jgi:hypothetical protein
MVDQKRSPLPWSLVGGTNDCKWVQDITAADDNHVVCMGHDYNEGECFISVADARFIVTACNAFPELVAALQLVRSWQDGNPNLGGRGLPADIAAVVRQTLAKVEG